MVVLAVLPAAKAARAVMVVLPAPPAVMVRVLLAQLVVTVRVLLAVPLVAMVRVALLVQPAVTVTVLRAVQPAVMVTDMVQAQGTLPRVKETIARLQRLKAKEMIVLLPKDIPPTPRIALHLQWPPFAQSRQSHPLRR
jgi:hypothetical protein